ncbi:MAG: SDR family NAD(P)-dependent oxidoreductase [Rhodococcus sp. (in: high G+C Gram-positive bacteria)]
MPRSNVGSTRRTPTLPNVCLQLRRIGLKVDLTGRLALITGASRSQGRSHATKMASTGAGMVAVNINAAVDGVINLPSTLEDVADTVHQVKRLERRVTARTADERDGDELRSEANDATAILGGIDIIVANAGIVSVVQPYWELSRQHWQTMLDCRPDRCVADFGPACGRSAGRVGRCRSPALGCTFRGWFFGVGGPGGLQSGGRREFCQHGHSCDDQRRP